MPDGARIYQDQKGEGYFAFSYFLVNSGGNKWKGGLFTLQGSAYP